MGMGWRTWIPTVCVALAVCVSPGCGTGPKVARDDLNFVLITLDTTRQDQLGCYGNRRGLTPNLDALAGECVVFEEAVSPVPLTLPAHASMLTGLYPLHHGIRINGWFLLADEQVSLSEILRDRGFATAAVLGSYILDRQFQLDQGFDFYDDDMSKGFQENEFSPIERRADAVSTSAFQWLEEHREERFFLWIHYYDPHHPYAPPPEYDVYGTSEFARYQGEVAYTDHHVGLAVEKLRELGLYDRTLLVVAGDHGEAFGGNDEYGHGLFIYNTTLLVPLMIRLPNVEGLSVNPGRRVGGRVSLVDIAPTVLEILGCELAVPVDGRSLLPYLEGKAEDPDWPLYAESAMGKLTRGWSQLSGVYAGNHKYILAPTPELYDLSQDPEEARNLAPTLPSQAEQMKERLVDMISQPASFPGSATFEMDADAEERLRSLGYITGSSLPKEDLEEIESNLIAACQTGKDPKDMIEYDNMLSTAMNYLVLSQPGRALRVLREARKMVDEEDPHLLSHMASAYRQLKLFDAAIETYKQILEIHPHESRTMSNLALAYHSKGHSTRAVEILSESVRQSPQFYEVHLNLANVYDDMRQYERADREYEAALELAPTAAGKREEVRYNIAVSLFRRDRIPEAQELLESVLEERPDHGDARELLNRLKLRQQAQPS